ncbi:kinase-like domain-containing protein [Xylariaceae sp. FL0662B]|nr:kinase-like domain-containing protein [Xylariaceae sp. FL0662B]
MFNPFLPIHLSRDESLWVPEEIDQSTGDFQYTMLVKADDDMTYHGQSNRLNTDISFLDKLPLKAFVKRLRLALCHIFFKHKSVHLLPKLGLVLDRHIHDLNNYLKSDGTIQNEKVIMKSLVSHSLSSDHNDLNHTNVLVAEDRGPSLNDCNSARRIAAKLSTIRGTNG